jgi:hypothetical protein
MSEILIFEKVEGKRGGRSIYTEKDEQLYKRRCKRGDKIYYQCNMDDCGGTVKLIGESLYEGSTHIAHGSQKSQYMQQLFDQTMKEKVKLKETRSTDINVLFRAEKQTER